VVSEARRRPERGEIWWVNLDPTIGSEQAGKRPIVVISSNSFHRIQKQIVVAVPMTRSGRPFRFHLRADPDETGLPQPGWIMCDQVRSISAQRMLDPFPAGRVSLATMARIEALLRALLDLP
jgi:mRNA interferase MazF